MTEYNEQKIIDNHLRRKKKYDYQSLIFTSRLTLLSKKYKLLKLKKFKREIVRLQKQHSFLLKLENSTLSEIKEITNQVIENKELIKDLKNSKEKNRILSIRKNQ